MEKELILINMEETSRDFKKSSVSAHTCVCARYTFAFNNLESDAFFKQYIPRTSCGNDGK